MNYCGQEHEAGESASSEANLGDAMAQVVNAADPPTVVLDIIERVAGLQKGTARNPWSELAGYDADVPLCTGHDHNDD